MSERDKAELELLRTQFSEVELRTDDLWARIPAYPLPPGLWVVSECEVAFHFPLPGQPPYGFWTRPGLTLLTGAQPNNYQYPVQTPFGDGWGQFSWAPEEPWAPGADVRRGANMLRWVQSFTRRLAEGA
jgi:hypothetical protein